SRELRAIAAVSEGIEEASEIVGTGAHRFMVAAWRNAKRGAVRFDQFLEGLERTGAIGRVEDLTPADLRALRAPFDEGLRRALEGFIDPALLNSEARAALSSEAIDEAAAFGRFIGLSDEEAIEVIELQARIARETDASELSPEALRAALRER